MPFIPSRKESVMKKKRGFAVFLLINLIAMCCIHPAVAATVPKKAKIHNQLGNDYCDKGEFEKGVDEYDKALALYPDYSDALYNVGLTCYMDLKDYGKAIGYFKHFIKVEGDTADSRQIKKWLAEAEKKVAAKKKSGQEEAKKELPPKTISSSEKAAREAEKAEETQQVAKTVPPPQEAGKASPVYGDKKPTVEEKPTALAPSTSPQKTASTARPTPEPKGKQAEISSIKEEARIYKDRGNTYNGKGKPEQAVKEYLKALQIYPQYPDALYNIAKTYDFNLKDYANAIQYYKRFLECEKPSSPDAAQVKIWLGRVEQEYQAQNKAVTEPSKARPSVPATASTEVAAAPEGKSFTNEDMAGDFFVKGLLSTSSVKAGEDSAVKTGEEAVKENSVRAKKPESPAVAQSNPVDAGPQAAAAQPTPAVAQPPAPDNRVAVAAPLPEKSVSSEPAADNRKIIVETIIPKNLRANDIVPIVMSRMQEEITEIFAQHKVQSPEKLAELYLSKIKSDILPSGEKVSSFRLEGKELADLPYIRILTDAEKRDLEKEKWDLIRTRKSPARLREVLTLLRDGCKVVPQ